MAFDLTAFRSQLQYDGARPNLFEVILIPPTSIVGATLAGQKIRFFCHTAQIPGNSIGEIPVYYFGRTINVPGNKVFQPWVVTIQNDEDFAIRNVMERWSAAINSHESNVRRAGFLSPSQYGVNGAVIQYSKLGTGVQLRQGPNAPGGGNTLSGATGIRKYNFIGLWPADVSPIDVSWSANDQIEEFVVTFSVQWWEVEREPDAGLRSKVSVG